MESRKAARSKAVASPPVSTSMSDLQFLSDIFFVFRHYYEALYSKALAWSLTISESLYATLCKAKAERILFVVEK